MTMSVLCLFSHFYLLLKPYNNFAHVPNFCIIVTLIIFGFHWKRSKETFTATFYIKNEKLNSIEKKLLVFWGVYIVFNMLFWVTFIKTDKFPVITQEGVSFGVFLSFVFYTTFKHYKDLSQKSDIPINIKHDKT